MDPDKGEVGVGVWGGDVADCRQLRLRHVPELRPQSELSPQLGQDLIKGQINRFCPDIRRYAVRNAGLSGRISGKKN